MAPDRFLLQCSLVCSFLLAWTGRWINRRVNGDLGFHDAWNLSYVLFCLPAYFFPRMWHIEIFWNFKPFKGRAVGFEIQDSWICFLTMLLNDIISTKIPPDIMCLSFRCHGRVVVSNGTYHQSTCSREPYIGMWGDYSKRTFYLMPTFDGRHSQMHFLEKNPFAFIYN